MIRKTPNKPLEDLLMEDELTAKKVTEKKAGEYRVWIQVIYPGNGEDRLYYDVESTVEGKLTLDIAVGAMVGLDPEVVYVTSYGLEVCTDDGWEEWFEMGRSISQYTVECLTASLIPDIV